MPVELKVVSALALFSFSKRVRLRTPNEFKAVFQHRHRLSEDGFSAAFCRNDLGVARLGLSIAKRMVKRAVDRNRLKRVIREAFRHYQDNLTGFDIVVMVKYPLANGPQAEVDVCIKRLLQKLERQFKKSSTA